jgi:ubiquinone/menaquinone biosynthesis C-methylase UbiE
MHTKRFEGNIDRLRFPERVERLELVRVLDLCLEDLPIANVLDVGTGTGLFAEAFFQRGLQVSGLDVNPDMVAAARRFVPKGDFRQGAAEALPYPDSSFDLVFLGLLLHEADDPLKTLKEARRTARHRVGILEWPFREQPFGPPLADRLDAGKLAELLTEAGFRTWKMNDLTNTVFYRVES